MKRAARFKLKRFNTSRILFSLAVCSFALVGFSATAYSLAIPSALMGVQDTHAFTVEQSGAASVNNEGASKDTDGTGTAVSGYEGTASMEPGTLDGAGITPGSLADAPTFSFTSPDTGEKTSDAPSPVTPSGGNGGNPGNGSQGGYSPPEPDTGLSPEIEADIHAHLVDCYSDLEPYYNQVCAGFNNLYATMNNSNLTCVSCALTNANLLINTCDQARIRTHSYRHNGEDVMDESKWYEESWKIANCFNDLTNACSVMREMNGSNIKDALGILNHYSNSNGEVGPLAEFRVRYASIRL